jgi:hypothetical protein
MVSSMSKRSAIREALLSKGEKEAWKVGRELKVKDATIKAYIGHFAKEKGEPTQRREAPAAKRGSLKPISSAFSDKLGVGVTVFDIGEPRALGVIKEFGPEVSRVHFPHRPDPWYVSNAYLQAAKENAKERAKQIDHWLDVLHKSRVLRVQDWIKDQKKKVPDAAIWDHIKEKWPTLSREDREEVYQECG